MINIAGLALLIVVTVFAYKTAKDYGRNAVGWALITLAVGFCLQIILPIILVIVIGVAMLWSGSSPEQMQQEVPAFTVTVLGIILSIAAGMLILRYLSKIPDEQPFDAPPAPPTDFNQNS